MPNQITLNMLTARVDYLNKITNSPMSYGEVTVQPVVLEILGIEKTSFKSNHGHFYIGQQYGGVSLERVHGEGGGCETIFHTTTRRDLFNQINAFRMGIEEGKQ